MGVEWVQDRQNCNSCCHWCRRKVDFSFSIVGWLFSFIYVCTISHFFNFWSTVFIYNFIWQLTFFIRALIWKISEAWMWMMWSSWSTMTTPTTVRTTSTGIERDKYWVGLVKCIFLIWFKLRVLKLGVQSLENKQTYDQTNKQKSNIQAM